MKIIVFLLATALGCATPPPPPPRASPVADRPPPAGGSNAVDDMLRDDLAQDQAFPWAAARPLTWSDFQGPPPAQGIVGAKTSYALYSAWRCRGAAFVFRVIVGFRPRQSWVKPIVLKDSVQRRTILGHEQTHFDLGEVHARRMRQVFRDLPDACRKTDAQLGALAEQLAEDEKVEQRRYDAETNHGLLTVQQAAWTQQTRRRLAVSQPAIDGGSHR